MSFAETAVAVRPLNRLLKLAVMAGVESSVRVHISRGDELDARDATGKTPLMLAAMRDRAAICTLLLEAGADPALRDADGADALATARAIGATAAASAMTPIKYGHLNLRCQPASATAGARALAMNRCSTASCSCCARVWRGKSVRRGWTGAAG